MSRILLAVTFFALIAPVAFWSGRARSSPLPAQPPLEEAPPAPTLPSAAVATDRLVLLFRPGASVVDVSRVLQEYHGTEARYHALSQLHEITVAPSAAAAALEGFRANPAVAEAGYSHIARVDYVPNDTNYSDQWNMQVTVGGSHAETAWDIATHHGQGVVVAVIDSGVAFEDYTGPGPISPSTVYKQAPDLAGKTFVSPWDFVNGDAHPNDDNGHGTHVTGTIAEDTNNNYGVAGVAYDATIMPLKVINFNGSGNDTDVIDAIYYAVDHGADVISMSLEFQGSGAPDTLGNYCGEVVGLPDALDYAFNHGVTVVAAAGNEGGIVTCPAAYPTVIAVGAARLDGQTTSYSNFGPPLDIVAPGGDPNVDQNGDNFPDGVPQQTFCDDYSTLLLAQDYEPFCDVFESGTSMATPHVAGAAALLLGEDPTLTPNAVRGYLESTARDRGPAGWDEHYGWGALDIHAAVASLLVIAPTATSTATLTPTSTSAASPTITPTPCVADADCDGVPDAIDNCPSVPNPDQANSDAVWDNGPSVAGDDTTVPNSDTIGDACDGDDDNDGLVDSSETAASGCGAFDLSVTVHTNPAGGDYTNDDDGDGNLAPPMGSDSADDGPSWDTDNDGVLDGVECALGFNPRDAASRPSALQCGGATDVDLDGLPASVETCKWGTSDTNADSDGDGIKDCVEANDLNGDGYQNFPGDTVNSAKAAAGVIGKTMDFDLNGDGQVNFPGDTILSAKMAAHVGGICM